MTIKETIILVSAYYPPCPGGVENYVYHLAHALAKSPRHRVVVVTTGAQGGPDNETQEGGVTVHRLGYQYKISNTPIDFGWCRKLREIISRETPTLIHVHAPVPGLADMAAWVSGEIPLVVTYHAGSMKKHHQPQDALIWLYEHVCMHFMLRKARVIACSSQFVSDFLARYWDKTVVITPAVDTERYVPRVPMQKQDKLLFVAALGKAEAYKGVAELLQTFVQLRKRHPRLTLSIVGEGDMRTTYMKQVQAMGLADVIFFPGKLMGEDLVRAYQEADIFVLPTKNDSTPIVLIEAMSSGLGIVSTTTGGIPQLIRHGTDGLLVPPGDTHALEEAIEQLLTDDELRAQCALHARARAVEAYGWADRIKQYQDAYDRALPSHQRTRPILLLACPYYPPMIGGVERYVSELAEGVQASGKYQVFVLTTGAPDVPSRAQPYRGVLVFALRYARKISNTPIGIGLAWRIRRVIRQVNPDVIHVHAPVPFMAEVTAFVHGRIPLFLTYHAGSMKKGVFLMDSIVRLYESIILPWLARRAHHIFAVSTLVRDGVLQAFTQKISIMSPSVRVGQFPYATRESDAPRVTFVGRMDKHSNWKGVDVLIRAFARVSQKIPEATLELVGDGDALSQHRALAESLGVADRVVISGVLTGDALAEAYRRATLVVLPSLTDAESFGMTLVEAMATGRPVIGSRVGGIPTVITHQQNGLLVPPGDIVELSNAILRILTHPKEARQFGDEGYQMVLARYTHEASVRGHISAYEHARLCVPQVVHVAGYYPPHVGGLERMVQASVEMLAQSTMPVAVVTSDIGGPPPGVTREGFLTRYVCHAYEFAHTPISISLVRALWRTPKEALMHLHLAHAFLPELVLLIHAWRGVPYIVHFHLDVAPSGVFGRLFLLYKWIVWPAVFAHAERIITCTQEQATMLSREYGIPEERMTVIPNAVGEHFFATHPHELVPDRPLALLYIGRLTNQKRVDRIIDAMALISVPATLTIVGDGEDRASLEAQVRRLGLTGVRFVGAANDAQMRSYHQSHDIFVMASEREGGTPLVALEAMAAGLPIVATNVSGVSDLLGGIALLVDAPYPKSIASAIEHLSAHPDMYAQHAERSHARARGYTWALYTERLRACYTSVKNSLELHSSGVIARSRRTRLAVWGAVLWGSALLLMTSSVSVLHIAGAVIGLPLLLSVPGFVLVRSLRLASRPWWVTGAMVIALSLMMLMVLGLGLTTLWALGWLASPLSVVSVRTSVTFMMISVLLWYARRGARPLESRVSEEYSMRMHDWLIAWFPLVVLVPQAVLGAQRLNADMTGRVTFVMLCMSAIWMGLLIVRARHLSERASGLALYGIGLALLLMTSMRGSGVVGHDIAREYLVLQLALSEHRWDVSLFRDAYNACLSITLLPAMLVRMFEVSGVFLYKFVFQAIFALVVPLVYATTRVHASRTLAMLAALVCATFPTFFTDMPMLIRQEIAFLFLALMLYLMIEGKGDAWHRRLLWCLFGVGMILSHYSTTYIAIVLFAFTAIGIATLVSLGAVKRPHGVSTVTLPLIGLLALLTVLWTGVVTQTAGESIVRVVDKAIAGVLGGESSSARPGETGLSLFSFARPDQADSFRQYVREIVLPLRHERLDVHYPPEAYLEEQFEVELLGQTMAPLTPFGETLTQIGISPYHLISTTRQGFAKFFQVMILIGLIGLLWRMRRTVSMHVAEHALFALGSVCLLFLLVLIPVLSQEYGVLRAFQQSLFALAPVLVSGWSMLFRGVSGWRIQVIAGMFVLYVLAISGVLTTLMGGYDPQLHLNNTGTYYHRYYVTDAELSGVAWVEARRAVTGGGYQVESHNERFSIQEPHTVSYVHERDDIFPGLLRTDSYVFLGGATVLHGRSLITPSDVSLDYRYPVSFLDAHKDLVYANDEVRVYR